MAIRGLWRAFRPVARSISDVAVWASSVAIMWFLFHTVPLDKHSIINLSLIFLLTLLGLGVPAVSRISPRVAQTLVILFALFALTGVSGFMHTGELSSPRASVLILAFVLLGVAVGFVDKQDAVLVGLGWGTFLVHAQGVLVQYLDPSRRLLTGDYHGVTGRESTEILSAFVGLAVGLALIAERGPKKYLAVVLLSLNSFMIWRIDLTIGLSVGAFMVLIAMVISMVGKRANLISRSRLTWGIVALGILLSAFVAQRSVALRVAEFLGERESVEARFEIWDSAISSVSTLGFVFGHGASFWREGSETLELTQEALQGYGLRAFGHAHSMYLDLFLSYGVVGIALIAALIVVLYGRTTLNVSRAQLLNTSKFAWVLIPSLALFGISESVLIFYPPGWFLGAILLGLLLRKPSQNLEPKLLSDD